MSNTENTRRSSRVNAFGRSIFESSGTSTVTIHLNHARLAAFGITFINSILFLYASSSFFLVITSDFPVVNVLSFLGGLGAMFTFVIAADLFLTGLMITRWLLVNAGMLLVSIVSLWGVFL